MSTACSSKRAGTAWQVRDVQAVHSSQAGMLKPGQVVAEFESHDGRRVTVRALKRSDLGSLLKFAGTILREKAGDPDFGIISLDTRPTRAEEREFLGKIIRGIARHEVASLAAFVDGELVGHADVWRRRPRDVRHTGVFGIIVRDGYRNVGIGERLMREVLEQSRRQGVWLVELTLFATNDRAAQLYEKLGFVKVGTVPGKFLRRGRQIDEVVMYADLRRTDKSSRKRRRPG